jgi:hypothetical protein
MLSPAPQAGLELVAARFCVQCCVETPNLLPTRYRVVVLTFMPLRMRNGQIQLFNGPKPHQYILIGY